jgi:hypothetical protein
MPFTEHCSFHSLPVLSHRPCACPLQNVADFTACLFCFIVSVLALYKTLLFSQPACSVSSSLCLPFTERCSLHSLPFLSHRLCACPLKKVAIFTACMFCLIVSEHALYKTLLFSQPVSSVSSSLSMPFTKRCYFHSLPVLSHRLCACPLQNVALFTACLFCLIVSEHALYRTLLFSHPACSVSSFLSMPFAKRC